MRLDNLVMPWKCSSFHIVSLLDMIKFCANEFWDFVWGLEALFKDGVFNSSKSAFTREDVNVIKRVIEKASWLCKLAELDGVSEVINQIESKVKNLLGWFPEAIPPVELGANFAMLRYIIEAELSKRLFMYIPKDHAEWYQKKDGFGMEVSEAFPSATKDIQDAGTCYAVQLYNASIFHSMRVLEYGLNAFAKEVGVIIKRQTWATVIKDIEEAIKTETNREHKEFLYGAALEFRFFKDVWRNHVSHNRRDYDKFQALSVLHHVNAFMVHLAKKIKE